MCGGHRDNICKRYVKRGLGDSQRLPKDIFNRDKRNGRRDNGARAQALAEGAGCQGRARELRLGPGPGLGTLGKTPGSWRLFVYYFLSMSFEDLRRHTPNNVFHNLFTMFFWTPQNHLLPAFAKYAKGDSRSIIKVTGRPYNFQSTAP